MTCFVTDKEYLQTHFQKYHQIENSLWKKDACLTKTEFERMWGENEK